LKLFRLPFGYCQYVPKIYFKEKKIIRICGLFKKLYLCIRFRKMGQKKLILKRLKSEKQFIKPA